MNAGGTERGCANARKNVAVTPFGALRLLRTAQEATGNVMAAHERWRIWRMSRPSRTRNSIYYKELHSRSFSRVTRPGCNSFPHKDLALVANGGVSVQAA